MSLILVDMGPHQGHKGRLKCDVTGCKAQFIPRSWSTDHTEIQMLSSRQGWKKNSFNHDLCPSHSGAAK